MENSKANNPPYCYVDANVFVYYQTRQSPFHDQSVQLLEEIGKRNFILAISPLVLDEAIFALTKSISTTVRHVRAEKAKEGLKIILNIPKLTLLDHPAELCAYTSILTYHEEYGMGIRDASHLLVMKHHHVSWLATFDKDFNTAFTKGVIKDAKVFLSERLNKQMNDLSTLSRYGN